ncbi:MAG: hypothetical protein J6A52_05215 [Bacilli bacterium]|nr:hypothetical protein [Bacilli bacterium]
MKRTLLMVRNQTFVILYVIAIFVILAKVGETNKITTYNVSGISSLQSSHLVTELKQKEEIKVEKNELHKYRLTSYYPGDECASGHCTGSGLCTDDFQVNKYGWYTYKGKIVLAAATTYLQNKFGVKENKLYFKYYDEVTLTIDGKEYKGIILDTCGACYKAEKIDLYVQNKSSVIDRGYRGYNMISLEVTKKK